MKRTIYRISQGKFKKHVRFALVSDLHSASPKWVINELRKASPDYILLAGDIVEALDGSCDEKNTQAFELFSASAAITPTFYCTGNHEDGAVHSQSKKWKTSKGKKREYSNENLKKIEASGVTLLLDSYVLKDGIAFGGLASGLLCEGNKPNIEFLSNFSKIDAPKVLICHHPEYYEPFIRDLQIDLTVSGHAHGGQWRIFGRGVYAPGQGLFPKYTSGVHDGRLVVSRGLKPPFPIPRFFNTREIVIIDI